jgi:hypothetical protein
MVEDNLSSEEKSQKAFISFHGFDIQILIRMAMHTFNVHFQAVPNL